MLNRVNIQGRLGRDPELRRTGNGVAVVNFAIACDRDFAKDGERETDWVEVVAWRNTAEFAEKYFHKGDNCIVTGRLQSRRWEDKNGNKRTTIEVVADNIYFCGGKGKQGDVQEHEVNTKPVEFVEMADDDSLLPF